MNLLLFSDFKSLTDYYSLEAQAADIFRQPVMSLLVSQSCSDDYKQDKQYEN